MENKIFDPNIPYSGPIYGGKFEPGKVIRIQGIIPTSAYRFDLNLHCGPAIVSDDIAIQILVELSDDHIVLNSLRNGIWGEELRRRGLTMQHGTEFEITLVCDFNQYYKVIINGEHYCDFPQRIPYNRITYLTIRGDISVSKILYDTSEGQSQNSRGVDLNITPLSSYSMKKSSCRNVQIPHATSSITISTPTVSNKSCKQSVVPPPSLYGVSVCPYPASSSCSTGPDPYPKNPPPVQESVIELPPHGPDEKKLTNTNLYNSTPSTTVNISSPNPVVFVPRNASSPSVTTRCRRKRKMTTCGIIIVGTLIGISIIALMGFAAYIKLKAIKNRIYCNSCRLLNNN